MKQAVRLAKVLGRADVLALSFGAMIGWAWVILPDRWILSAGSGGAMAALGMGGIVVLLVGLTYAELTAAMPKVGGEHVFSYRALGVSPSFVCTWAIISGYVSVCAFEAVAISSVVEALAPGLKSGLLWNIAGSDVYVPLVAVATIASALIVFVNYIGVKPAAFVQMVLTIALGLGGAFLVGGSAFSGAAGIENMKPFFLDAGMSGILVVLLMTPFLFVGFDTIPQAAEEINLPPREIGTVLMFSVVLAIVWYILIVLGVSLAFSPADLQKTGGVVAAEAATKTYGGEWAGTLIIFVGLAGILTGWNSFLIGGSRAIYAMAHARMLPAFLGKLHPRYKTPSNAILLIGLITLPAPLLGRTATVWFVNAGSLAIVVAWFVVAVSFMVLRRREPEMPRPYRVPFGNFVGAAAVIVSGALILLYLPLGIGTVALVWQEWLIVAALTLLGGLLYGYSLKSYGQHTMVSIMEGGTTEGT